MLKRQKLLSSRPSDREERLNRAPEHEINVYYVRKPISEVRLMPIIFRPIAVAQ